MNKKEFFFPEQRRVTRERETKLYKPVNVQCEKCLCWGWVEWFKETETGYICNDCLEKPFIQVEIKIENGNNCKGETKNLF